MTAKSLLQKSITISAQRYKNYQAAQTGTKELILITDAYYRRSFGQSNESPF